MTEDNVVKNSTWHELQEQLRNCKSEEEVQVLIDEEQSGPNRARWLNRMAGRYKVLRNERQDRELQESLSKKED